jgi:hypothetical protein
MARVDEGYKLSYRGEVLKVGYLPLGYIHRHGDPAVRHNLVIQDQQQMLIGMIARPLVKT